MPQVDATAPDALDTTQSEQLARKIASLCDEAKAQDVQVLRVLELVAYTDWFVVCTGRSDRHVRAIHDLIWDELARDKVKPLAVEGTDAAQWILMDYGSVVVHVFYEPVREFYALERLWSEAPRLDLPKLGG
ncbi:MAG: ribosome silencing factor [Deltaproteobacteria bacterium]|nr:ribosome silencing factor [Deltaproteobacteria bacterium]